MGEKLTAKDPIVDEVRRVREDEAAKYGFRCQGDPRGLEQATTSLQARGRIVCAEEEVERLTCDTGTLPGQDFDVFSLQSAPSLTLGLYLLNLSLTQLRRRHAMNHPTMNQPHRKAIAGSTLTARRAGT
jgi:hypothetical protein